MKGHTPRCKGLANGATARGDESKCNCDGYHTFDELYEHRAVLFIALCYILDSYQLRDRVWRSKKHAHSPMYEGMFILGISKEKGQQITYHLEIDKWEDCNFAETLDKAPEFDGHTSDDVLDRLKKL